MGHYESLQDFLSGAVAKNLVVAIFFSLRLQRGFFFLLLLLLLFLLSFLFFSTSWTKGVTCRFHPFR